MNNNHKKSVWFLFVSGIALAIIFSLSFFWSYLTSPLNKLSKQTVVFSIQSGETVDSIGRRLTQEKLIRSQAAFKITVTQHGLAKKIQAGQFQLSPNLTVKQIAETLTVGRDDVKITIIEGWRREEIAEALGKQLTSQGVEFDSNEFLMLTKGMEGFLFPDTYFFPRSVTAGRVVEIMQTTFEHKVDSQIQEKIRNQGLTLQQAITIASIVEREARDNQERPVVAGILLKRLRNNWPLQADATIQYALGYQSNTNKWWKKDLTRADIDLESVYNSYIQIGLPPGPICNPSLSSIRSVAEQKPTKYWFYISDLEGNMHYAETIEQHNANIAIYLNK